jgi:hypothetical protein
MSNEQNPGIETGWSLQVNLRAEVNAFGGTSTPDTAYHEINPVKAIYYPETDRSSARISLRCDVVRSEPGKDSRGRGFTETLWLGFHNPEAAINRMRASNKFKNDADMKDALDREEGLLKTVLISLGYPKEAVKAGAIGLAPATFTSMPDGSPRTGVCFYERSVKMDGFDVNGKPNYSKSYKSWASKEETESCLSGTKAPPKLFNEGKGIGQGGRGTAQAIAPMGSTGIPGALGAAPTGQGLATQGLPPQGQIPGAPMANPLQAGAAGSNNQAGQAGAVLGAFQN